MNKETCEECSLTRSLQPCEACPNNPIRVEHWYDFIKVK